jgi:hypothetical protein
MADRNGESELARAALALVEVGTPVFPLRPRGKQPRTSNGFKAATLDVDLVRGWWTGSPEQNIGVPLGRATGLAVLDIDPRHGGEETLAELLGLLSLPETLTMMTAGPDEGRQYIFTITGPVRTRTLGPGLELRADGAYSMWPPSVHPDTGRTRYFLDPDVPPAPLPEDVLGTATARSSRPAEPVSEVIPHGQRRRELLSLAGSMRRRGMDGAEILSSIATVNARRCVPPLPDTELTELAHDVGERYEPDPDTAIVTRPVRSGEASLDEVVATFRRWLYLPDAGALYVTLATVAANRLPADPVWLLLVGPSSVGKTELLVSLTGLDEIVSAAALTEASLLSGVPRKDVTKGATGGLLRKIGDYGILALKDFGSVLSMRREARSAVLGALREIYDGSWNRPMGVDGGRVLSWSGKLGLVAGVTTVVDRHHALMDSLGSRFALYRLDVGDRDEQTRRALAHHGKERDMRGELRDVVTDFFAGLELEELPGLLADDVERIVSLAGFVTRARSPVERDSFAAREIELVPDAEGGPRLGGMLASLLSGLRVVGLDDEAAWPLVEKVALDSMPATRRRVLEHLDAVDKTTTKAAATLLGLPTTTTRRVLEDLAAHGVVGRSAGDNNTADVWRLAIAFPKCSGCSIRASFKHKNPETDISGTRSS